MSNMLCLELHWLDSLRSQVRGRATKVQYSTGQTRLCITYTALYCIVYKLQLQFINIDFNTRFSLSIEM